MKRTHHCAQLIPSDIGATATLTGWVDTIRDQGGIIFVDLRDRKGITQIKLEPHDNANLAEQLKHLKLESVISISGAVSQRPEGTENPDLPTGQVEVVADALDIHNIAETPPFPSTTRAVTRLTTICVLPTATLTCAVRACAATSRCGTRSPNPSATISIAKSSSRWRPRFCSRAPRGRPGVSGAFAYPSGRVLRAFAVAPAIQTDPHGGGSGALFPDCPLFSRRGSARGPPDGVHTSRRGSVLCGPRGHLCVVRRHGKRSGEMLSAPRSPRPSCACPFTRR